MDKLFIDVGNSAIKWRLNKTQVQTVLVDDFAIDALPKIKSDSLILISIVANYVQLDVIKEFYQHNQIFVAKTHKQYKQLINAYDQVDRLGVDRWLNLIASYELFRQQNCLIISFGTATTLDVLNQTGQHQGGLILPALALLKQGFERFNQPEIVDNLNANIQLSNQTHQAWQFGCEALWFHGIYQIIHQLYLKYNIDTLVMTGGYANLMMDNLDLDYCYNEDLIFSGLDFLWHNKNE